MSANLRSPERSDQTTNLLESISPGLSNASLQDVARTAESIDTVIFALNPWCPIPNVTLSGFTFGVQYVVLPRMRLIPLKTWKQPEIQPRNGGWAPGSVTAAGFFPSGSVGSKVTQRFQFPSESAKLLMGAFGSDSPNNVGMAILNSLTAVKDTDKLESVLLFRAVMETPLAENMPTGSETLLEHLPAFLKGPARELLLQALTEGVTLNGKVYKFRNPETAELKGDAMIDDIEASVAAATRAALDENTGVLTNTKRELIQSAKGQKDVKLTPDKRDEFLLVQFPSFSLDTDVERVARGNASLIDAVRDRGKESNLDLRDLLEMNRETLAQLKRANDLNAEMAARLLGAPPAAAPPPG